MSLPHTLDEYLRKPWRIRDQVDRRKPGECSGNDPVNSPSHYTVGEIECIDAIKAALGEEGFKAFCRGNALKYIWRLPHKQNPKQDLEKAIWYLKKMREEENEKT